MDPWNNSQAGQIYDINTNHEDYFSNEHPLTCPPTEGYIENSVKKNSIPSLLSLPFDPNSLSTYQSPPFLNTNFQSEVNSLPSSGHNAPPDPSSFLTIANGQYRCNLCAVSVCGPEPYKQHIAGRKHQFNVSEALAQSNSAIDCPNSSHYSGLYEYCTYCPSSFAISIFTLLVCPCVRARPSSIRPANRSGPQVRRGTCGHMWTERVHPGATALLLAV